MFILRLLQYNDPITVPSKDARFLYHYGMAEANIHCIHEQSESDTQTIYIANSIIGEWSSPFCERIMMADSDAYGRMLFLDGQLQSASADELIYHEALVHPAMAAIAASNKQSLKVLVVGGGEGATVREVLKWGDVQSVAWVDIDNRLVALCREHLRWAPDVYEDRRVTYYADNIQNAWVYLDRDYDLIILDLPDPDGEDNYLYTEAFWNDVADHMGADGAVATHCGPVRPFGRIGEGLVRICEESKKTGRICFAPTDFYAVAIPSFQTEWGFLTWKQCGHKVIAENLIPLNNQIADSNQIAAWRNPTLLWRRATAAEWPYPINQ